MADFVRSFRDGIVQVRDGASKALVLADAEGDLEVTTSREVVELKNRGVLLDVKRGDVVPLEFNLSVKFRALEGVPEIDSDLRVGLTAVATALLPNAGAIASFPTSGEGLLGPENGASASQVPERISWTGKTATDLTGLTRGKDGTTAQAWAIGARLREIDTAKRTLAEFINRKGGYAGLTTTRASSDVFTFTLWFAVTDVDSNVDEIVELSDCYALKQTVKEGADYTTLSMSGRAWAAIVEQIPPP